MPNDASRPTLRRGAARHDRRARQADRHHPCADQRRARQPADAVGEVRARPASSICSTPASRSAKCRSMSRRSAATCCRRPAASSCAARAARVSSTCVGPCWSGSTPFPRPARGRWTRRTPTNARRRPPLRELGDRHVAGQFGLGVAIDYALAGVAGHPGDASRAGRRCGTKLSALPGVTASTTWARGGPARSSPSPSHGHPRRRGQAAPGTTHQRHRHDAQPARCSICRRAASRRTRARLHVHYYNTEVEVDALVEALS